MLFRGRQRMAQRPPAGGLAKIAKEILRTRWEFHPTAAAGMGLHAYDGPPPQHSPVALAPPVARMQSQVPRFLKELRATTDRRLPETFYEMAEMAARGMIDAYERELPEHLPKASPAVRRLVERTNAAALNELKILVHEFDTKYKPRVKKTFALGRRGYERMIRSEHLAPIPIDRLLLVGEQDLASNRAQ